jgi:cytochrome c553
MKTVRVLVLVIATLLLVACGGGVISPYQSIGERIYFTATDEQGERITYTGGPTYGGMMGMMNAPLACASCHGADGRGGVHRMHMLVMDAPDIRWSALAAEEEHGAESEGEDEHGESHAQYDLETFRLAVVEEKHPNGERLNSDMPRWNLSDDDLADLMEYLKSLP